MATKSEQQKALHRAAENAQLEAWDAARTAARKQSGTIYYDSKHCAKIANAAKAAVLAGCDCVRCAR